MFIRTKTNVNVNQEWGLISSSEWLLRREGVTQNIIDIMKYGVIESRGAASSLPLVCSLGHSKDAVHKSGKIRSAGRILTYCGIISSYAYICKLNIKCTILKLSGEFNTQVCLSCALPAPCLNIGRCMVYGGSKIDQSDVISLCPKLCPQKYLQWF